MIKYFIIFILLLNFAKATLPMSLNDMILKDKISSANLSILITNKHTGAVVASLNPYVSRVPASVAKIATTYAALLEFGKDFKWPTQIYYTGSLKAGILNGDLVVKAYGDPTLNARDVKGFAQKLRSYGIREIKGSIVIDRSFFRNSLKISSGFDKNFVSEYNAMPDALMYNDHLNRLVIKSTSNGVLATRSYGDNSFKVVNHTKAVSGVCRGKNAWPKISFLKSGGEIGISLNGTLSKRCKPIILNRVLSYPYKSFFYSFKYYLSQSGIKLDGSLKLKNRPKNSKLLFVHYSKPLIKIVAKTLKKSNNLYARHIFLILGAKKYGYPATLAKSQRAIKEILGEKGVLSNSDHLVNGCGLSRESRLSPVSAAKILDSAYKDFGTSWAMALSIAGKDGTIKKRFAHTIVTGRAFMKTGTLKKAKNIAGYVKSLNGNLYNCVIFYNGAKIWLGRDIQNKIITWLVRN